MDNNCNTLASNPGFSVLDYVSQLWKATRQNPQWKAWVSRVVTYMLVAMSQYFREQVSMKRRHLLMEPAKQLVKTLELNVSFKSVCYAVL